MQASRLLFLGGNRLKSRFVVNQELGPATRIGVGHRRSELIQRVRRVSRERSFHLRKVHFGLIAFQDNSLCETSSSIGETYKSPLKR
jgi:hypothetical protein